ncbi:MAG TPA: MaoC/PaaZ C-terminal domain-containing protein [Candidatus Dormibacteraeota bacterium]
MDLLYFEDLPLGGEWVTRRRTLTETDLALYRGLSGDLNPLHSDHDYAAQSPIGLSLPAALVMATAIGLGSVDVPVPATVALVGMTWKFVKPVRVGESVAARWRLNRKRDVENPQWGLASWQVDVIGPDGEVRASAEVSRLVARRTAAAEAEAAPRSRRRRGRRSSGSAAAPTPAVTQEVPEPAPADVPAPARRRRRRRSGGGNGGGTGGAGNGNHGGDAAAAPEPEPAPAPISTPAHQPAAAETAGAEPEGAGIGRVIRRIRRR